MPWVDAEGWVDFEISINGGPFMWTGKFFVETPARSPAMVWFQVHYLFRLLLEVQLWSGSRYNICLDFCQKSSYGLVLGTLLV